MANEITTFSAELSALIARYVKEEIASQGQPTDKKGGFRRARSVCLARITAATAENGQLIKHAWKEVRWNLTAQDFEFAPDGSFGTTTENYLVCGPDDTKALAIDGVYIVVRQTDPDTGNNIWVSHFKHDLIGQYQGMIPQTGVSQQLVFGYPECFVLPE